MNPTLDQVCGCILGLALGDAIGAPHEGGLAERLLWRVIGHTRNGAMRWTGDTQMTIDVIESFLERGRIDQDDLSARFAASYRFSRGYGPGSAKVLRRISKGIDWREANRFAYAAGSFGNGGAMRAPVVGLIYPLRGREVIEAATLQAEVTHAHPEGVAGAVILASVAASWVRSDAVAALAEAGEICGLEPFTSRFALAKEWLEQPVEPSHVEVARRLGNGVAARSSCITAVYIAARFHDRSFADMLDFTKHVGGDTDTIGAMAGALWGIANGYQQLPSNLLENLEQRDRLQTLAVSLHAHLMQAAAKK